MDVYWFIALTVRSSLSLSLSLSLVAESMEERVTRRGTAIRPRGRARTAPTREA
jgi:hypothetical protein